MNDQVRYFLYGYSIGHKIPERAAQHSGGSKPPKPAGFEGPHIPRIVRMYPVVDKYEIDMQVFSYSIASNIFNTQ